MESLGRGYTVLGVGELLGSLAFPPTHVLCQLPRTGPSGDAPPLQNSALHTVHAKEGVCVCVCMHLCVCMNAHMLGPLAVEWKSLQGPSELGGVGPKFPHTPQSLGRTSECPHSHAPGVYPAGEEQGLRVRRGAMSVQLTARVRRGRGPSTHPAPALSGLVAAPPPLAGASR